jgi:L-amino acid N-acyltransferase YncA
MLVRPATPDDARAIATIHVQTWRVAYRDIVPQAHLDALSIEQREQRWRVALENTFGRTTTVAESEGAVIGWCTYGPNRGPTVTPETGELWAIYVAAAHFGTGAGRALWLDARAGLAADAYLDAIVWVLRDNARALRFYEKAGFVLEPNSEKTIELGGAALLEVRLRCVL